MQSTLSKSAKAREDRHFDHAKAGFCNIPRALTTQLTRHNTRIALRMKPENGQEAGATPSATCGHKRQPEGRGQAVRS
jgi:hypothetical protein